MELNKEHWARIDIMNFRNYEMSLKGDSFNCEWEQRIVNTKLDCFARTSTKARKLANEICKGNYLEFLDNITIGNHLDSLVCAFLICKINDFSIFRKYLDKYALTIDNWASCDTLKFKNKNENDLVNLSKDYLKSNYPFVRRIGINIYFDLIKIDDKYLNNVFEILDSLVMETEYYVNMSAAWILAECFAVNKDKTLLYLETNKTNSFIINKGISKIRDSFRVSLVDKQYILNFKRK